MTVMKIKNPVPGNPEGWLGEIVQAYCDACDAVPFVELIDGGRRWCNFLRE
jgi:hypothetical protein